MSNTVPTYYSQQFTTNVQLLLQQKGSVLRDKVLNGSHVGKQAVPVEQVGAIAAKKRTTRYPVMNPGDVPADRPWVFPVDYDIDPILFDTADALKMIVDPRSPYATTAMYALGRGMDDEIIGALFGDRKTGENGSTTVAFPAGQQVSVNIGGTGSGLNVAKLRAGLKLLMAAEVDLDNDPVYCIVNAKQHDLLLNEMQIVSTDFNNRPVLVEGRVTQFLGINFVRCERIKQNGSSQDRVPLFAKSGVHLGVWQDVVTDISQRKDRAGLPWQLYCYGTYGATRLEEKKVVELIAA